MCRSDLGTAATTGPAATATTTTNGANHYQDHGPRGPTTPGHGPSAARPPTVHPWCDMARPLPQGLEEYGPRHEEQARQRFQEMFGFEMPEDPVIVHRPDRPLVTWRTLDSLLFG